MGLVDTLIDQRGTVTVAEDFAVSLAWTAVFGLLAAAATLAQAIFLGG